MENKLKRLSIVLLVLFMVVLFALPAFAQDDSYGEPDERGFSGDYEYIVLEPEERPPSPEEFGITNFIYTWIPATAFVQHTAAGRLAYAGGYHGRSSTTAGSFFTASLDLPTGVDIWGIRLYLYDGSSTDNITGWFTQRNVVTRVNTELYTFTTSGNQGYTTRTWDPVLLFDNYNQYQLRLRLDSTGSSHRFAGARIKYSRFIPSASTNTFDDVHPGDWYFDSVEALYAAGITTGWGGSSEFKPDNYVTRAQMAAFISRALGLYHPETSPY